MATPNYGFTTINGSDAIDIVNAVNIPVGQIDTALKTVDDAQDATAAGLATANGKITANTSAIATNASDITDLQSQVQVLSDRISGNDFDEVIMIGDSWANGQTSEGTSDSYSWFELLFDYIGKWTKKYTMAQNGAGFAQVVSGNSYASMISSVGSSISDKSKVTHIIFAGGINDVDESSATELNAAANTIMTYCSTNFPKAKVYVFNMPWPGAKFQTLSAIQTKANILNAFKNATAGSPAVCNECSTWLFGVSQWYGSGDHTTVAGMKRVSQFMADFILGGDAKVYYALDDITSTYGDVDWNFSRVNGDRVDIMFNLDLTANYPGYNNRIALIQSSAFNRESGILTWGQQGFQGFAVSSSKGLIPVNIRPTGIYSGSLPSGISLGNGDSIYFHMTMPFAF